MKVRQYKFDDTIEIVNLGDLHRGDKCCDVKAFQRVVAHIRDTPNCYWVSTGDLLNVALKSSKSDVYSSMSLQDELDSFISEIRPITNKCLGIVSSNHHDRLERETGLNLDQMVCQLTGIPYIGDIGVINITIRVGTCNTSYFIVMHHGIGGGGLDGGKVNDLVRLGGVISSADVYLQGHTHQYVSIPKEMPYIDRKRNAVQTITSHFVTTGHYLRWDDSYAQKLKLKPAPIGSAVVTLHGSPVGQHQHKRVEVGFVN